MAFSASISGISNHHHKNFQFLALPTELPDFANYFLTGCRSLLKMKRQPTAQAVAPFLMIGTCRLFDGNPWLILYRGS
jgi:hypothetical protein